MDKYNSSKLLIQIIVPLKTKIIKDITSHKLYEIILSFNITTANVHDINYLQDVKHQYHHCRILGDRTYIGTDVKLYLFETAHMKMDVPYRLNQKD